jgi:hypothetical protein
VIFGSAVRNGAGRSRGQHLPAHRAFGEQRRSAGQSATPHTLTRKGTELLIRLTAATMAAGAIALAAGCSTAGQTSTAAQHATTAPATPVHGTPTAAAPVLAHRLTMAQARAAYIRITHPFNVAVAAVNRDVADAAPWSQFRADTLAVIRADRAWARHVRAVRWPARVQRYITAMLHTDVPAEIRCDEAMAAAGGMQAATNVFNTSRDCKDNTADEDKIRAMLNLPSVD